MYRFYIIYDLLHTFIQIMILKTLPYTCFKNIFLGKIILVCKKTPAHLLVLRHLLGLLLASARSDALRLPPLYKPATSLHCRNTPGASQRLQCTDPQIAVITHRHLPVIRSKICPRPVNCLISTRLDQLPVSSELLQFILICKKYSLPFSSPSRIGRVV